MKSHIIVQIGTITFREKNPEFNCFLIFTALRFDAGLFFIILSFFLDFFPSSDIFIMRALSGVDTDPK